MLDFAPQTDRDCTVGTALYLIDPRDPAGADAFDTFVRARYGEDVLQAWNRITHGCATPEDIDLLERPA